MDVYKLWTCDDNSESQLSSNLSEIEKEIDVLRKTFLPIIICESRQHF